MCRSLRKLSSCFFPIPCRILLSSAVTKKHGMRFSIRELHDGGEYFRDSLGALSDSQTTFNLQNGEDVEPCSRGTSGMQRAPSPEPIEAIVPRILFFGGDVVSLASLKALHTRMRSILSHVTRSHPPCEVFGRRYDERIEALVRDHLTIVCPSLPNGLSPREAAKIYSRQYPIARYAATEGLRVIPVDHPRSLAKSRLLQEMLGGASDLAKVDCAAAARPESEGTTTLPPWTWRAAGRPLRDFDLAIVVSFRYFLPERLLCELPCTINMHPSLLPRYRGASPIFSTLMRNETEGGASVIRLPPGKAAMDSGDILWQRRMPIPSEMDIRGYLPLVVELGAAGLCEVVFGAPDSSSAPLPTMHPTSDGIPSALGVGQGSGAWRGEDVPAEAALAPSVRGAFSDWPRGFARRLGAAVPQSAAPVPHFAVDPFHAPLLPRSAAGLRFRSLSGADVFGVWRAFAGGAYFHPSVNATLDKGRTPAGARLLECARRRLARGARSATPRARGKPSGDAASVRGGGGGPDQGGRTADESSAKTLRDRAVEELRVSCTFTMALNPVLVPSCVLEELKELEAGDHLCFYQPLSPLGSREHTCPTDNYCSSMESGGDETIEQVTETGGKPTDVALSIVRPGEDNPCAKEGGESFPGCASTPHSQEQLIPPGTGYFPKCAKEIGAIKCRHAWFFWKQAHLKFAPRPQTAGLLCKGLGMKTGVLYTGLFSEYS